MLIGCPSPPPFASRFRLTVLRRHSVFRRTFGVASASPFFLYPDFIPDAVITS